MHEKDDVNKNFVMQNLIFIHFIGIHDKGLRFYHFNNALIILSQDTRILNITTNEIHFITIELNSNVNYYVELVYMYRQNII